MGTVVFINGRPFAPNEAKVSVFDRGLLYGDSVFETIGTYGGAPFALREHLQRLRRSAELVYIPLTDNDETITKEINASVAAAQNAESYIRLIVTRGSGELGLDPALATEPQRILIVTPLHRPSGETYAKGVKAVTARTHRATDASDTVGAKVGNYLVAVLAMRKAHAASANEALIVDRDGNVIEGATSNLFWVEATRLCTPPLSAGILEGITRGVVLTAAKELGIEVTLDSPQVDRLLGAKEVFITSSIRQMLSVIDIDGHRIADGRPGPMYLRIFERFLSNVHSAAKD